MAEADVAEESVDLPPAPSRRRRWRWAGVGLLVLVVMVAALWLARRPIASHYADAVLARAGVPARYRLADIGLGQQRLTGVVLGDPRAPDLVADWIETRTAIGWRGARLVGVRAGHVRLRARVSADGRVSLGTLDRLRPVSSGKAFALPALDVDVADARVRVVTPWGVVGVKAQGRGRLDGGFRGQAALVAGEVAAAGCTAVRPAGVLAVRVVRGAPSATGPVRLASLACGGVVARGVDATIDAGLDRDFVGWRGGARLAAGHVAMAGRAVERVAGDVSMQRVPHPGGAAGIEGALDLRTGVFDLAEVAGESARLRGRYRYSPVDAAGHARPMVVGFMPAGGGTPGMRLAVTGAHVVRARLAALAGAGGAARGTPLAPVVDRLMRAAAALGRRFDADADVQLELGPGSQGITLHRAAVHGAAGAQVTLRAGSVLAYRRTAQVGGGRRAGSGTAVSGTIATSGGGLPEATVILRQRATGAPVEVNLAMRPYAAGDASLLLTGARVRWDPGSGASSLATVARVSGPLGGGRVEALTLPLDIARDRTGRLTVNRACTPVTFAHVAIAGLALTPGRVTLCPLGASLVRAGDGGVDGGARVGAIRFAGTLGTTPLTLALGGGEVRLGDRGFVVRDVAARLGTAERVTRLDIATLAGRVGAGGVEGRFAGVAGQIGAVPLVLSGADGRWRVGGGALDLHGGLVVADAQAVAPRFAPMRAEDVALTLAGGRIMASGTLHEPTTDTRVAEVTLRHELATGRGTADLAVPGIAFGDALQPDKLTRLTYGVIADVRGTVAGEGHVAWGPNGVTSTGRFGTAGVDLAAAFGPVEGVAGELSFTDLLGLQTAPGQRVTVRSINPGIAVTDGVLLLQTLPGARIAVESGRWPFAGGVLTLAPTLLDFSATAERRMRFAVDGAAADKFLQQFDFKNLEATGTFDGVLPMVFDASGGRIEGGRLQVRPGGGTIAYVGAVTQKDVGLWGNLAFQALKSLRYRSLALTMDGPLAGEMVTEVRFAGISQGEGARANFLVRRLQRLPFVFNIRIRAPFRGLLDSAASFYDPKRLIARNLPQLLDEQNKRAAPPAIQPPASEVVP